ncbi:3-keto-5-aminohexanoate cleavage protein [Winogradskyella sp.]|uniref:3-keto-5-aminohexanoate cleavage protein n=1 Tax=Winogradskyella sp. TaxID=1883156 RepID=UPI0025F15B25|nr:3-keto-5-aminohexanoate cleavage protein [Winogradskyella sp.]
MDLLNKIIINFCPTGMIPTKAHTPFVPISPSEIIEQTHQAYEVGITIAHLHAREDNGVPTHRSSVYTKIFEGVRKYCPDLIICGSTSGRNVSEFEKRSEIIELMPDMCSLTLSSLNFIKNASVNNPDMIIKLAEKMKAYGVIPELECFGLGMINYGKYLIEKNIIEGPYYWNLLFGNISGMQADLTTISTALQQIPKNSKVVFAGLGVNQLKVNSLAISQSYGVRVGLEDNIWYDTKKTQKATNIQLLKRIHQLIEINEKEFKTPLSLRNEGFGNKLNVNTHV